MQIRVAEEKDAATLLEIYSYYVEKTAITFEYETPSIEEFTHRIHDIKAKYPYIVAEENGEILGYAYGSAFHPRAAYGWCAEMSIYVRHDRRGSGAGGRLYRALESLLAEMGILNLNACIAVAPKEDEYLTSASVDFHRHFGYKRVGEFHRCGYKFNRWYNMVWMEKMIGEHKGNPEPEGGQHGRGKEKYNPAHAGICAQGKRRSCQCICGPGSVFSDHVFYPVYTVSYNADPLYTLKL